MLLKKKRNDVTIYTRWDATMTNFDKNMTNSSEYDNLQ